MPNQITQVTHVGYGKRIRDSFLGAIVGFAMFASSFFVLSWNEQRVDISSIARTASALTGEVRTDSMRGPVSATGPLQSSVAIGDGLFVRPGSYVVIERHAETYAWVEKKQTTTQKELGGGETQTTTYTYSLAWRATPADSTTFKDPAAHENPKPAFTDATVKATDVTAAGYSVDVASLNLPHGDPLVLNSDTLDLGGRARIDGTYVYAGSGSLATPQLGDSRITYTVIQSGTLGTAFGELQDGKIIPYRTPANDVLYHWRPGSPEAAIAALHDEYVSSLWLFRLLGFVLMWAGLMLLLAPIGIILDFVPFLGSLGKFGIAITSLIVSVMLGLLTILTARLFHNGFLALGIGVALIGTPWVIARKRKGRADSSSAPAQDAAVATSTVPDELRTYVAVARASGTDDTAIRAALVGAGWDARAIDAAIGTPAP